MSTDQPPDPDPARTPGLEPGGGVPPGETPPDSGSTTVGLTHHERDSPRFLGPVVIGIIGVFVLAVVLFFVVRIFDLF
ncbi:hypothetical protein GIS00_13445 [Nakamurella sp. YIM 132087]|uniref:Uncharacterized protein n=1 Tax=Nakamurella alba TaxID=2665158 RepID=A0A7K1FQ62_9ACTN|nr:DUF6480 family protein [Nakamurella alba]MTD14944.1 hypothetical protein [Nakamurella alba]